MTKAREPLSFQNALCNVAASLGWDVVATICQRHERTVRNWSDPDTDQEISVLDARRLDAAFLAAGGDHAPFLRAFTLQLGLEARGPADDAQAIQDAAGRMAKECGEAISAMLQARTPAERRKAKRELKEAMEACGIGLHALGESGD